ncbi:UNVERIFIED_CONTAM: protein argonaute 4 [Sesamum radiatum]|uniref:Protein argonaute 4 n=1 Tax=Sesamum radiatum TaxID=300843 RepID=A0AAW2KZ38_SESRA
MVIQPGPVADFLAANQNVKDPFSLDWAKVRRRPSRLYDWSEKVDDDGEAQTTEVTVYDYFVNHRNINLRFSADLPCIHVGKHKHPTYFPIEFK